MKRNMFTIPGKLPGYNEQCEADRKNAIAGYRLRNDTENMILFLIRASMNRGNTRKIMKPCRIHFDWCECRTNRDLDNIFFAKKYILDALQVAGILPNDSQKWVQHLSDDFHKCRSQQDECIVVEIEELEDEKHDQAAF